MHASGPRLVVRVDHERLDRRLVVERPQHGSRAIRATERKARDLVDGRRQAVTSRDVQARHLVAAVATATRREPSNHCVWLAAKRDHRHSGRCVTRGEWALVDVCGAHGTGHVEEQPSTLARRLYVLERQLVRLLKRVDDAARWSVCVVLGLCCTVAIAVANLLAAVGVHHPSEQHLVRVQTPTLHELTVSELVNDDLGRVRSEGTTRHACSSESRKLTEQRRRTHAWEQRLKHLRLVDQRIRHSLPWKAVVLDELRSVLGVRRSCKQFVRVHQGRQALSDRAVARPIVEGLVVTRRSSRVRDAQHVTMRISIALTVLHHLQSDVVRRAVGVELADSSTKATPHATLVLDVAKERCEHGEGAAHLRHCGDCSSAELVVGRRARDGERKKRWLLLCSETTERDLADLAHECHVAGVRHSANDSRRVLGRRLGRRVVRAAVRAKDEESTKGVFVRQGEGVTTCVVLHLPSVGPLKLWSAGEARSYSGVDISHCSCPLFVVRV